MRNTISFNILLATCFCGGILSGTGTGSVAPHDLPMEQLCPGITLSNPNGVSFSDTEKRLICGDPSTPAWAKIPPNQALFNLKLFLQDRGHFFASRSLENGEWVYATGPQTKITSFKLIGAPPEVDEIHFASIEGQVLTPTLLGDIEARIIEVLESFAYACAKVKTKADPESGIVEITILPGEKKNILSVKADEVLGLWPDTLRRYDAFQLGDPGRGHLFPLTSRRAISDGVVQSTYFKVACEGDGIRLEQKIVPGAPRILTVGFGLNTDRGIVVKTTWKNTRLGNEGSAIDTSLLASFRSDQVFAQEFNLGTNWYLLPYPSRFFLRPALTLRHQSEVKFRVLTGKIQLSPSTSWDSGLVGFKASLGPTLNAERRYRGEGREKTYYMALAGDFRLMSHDFEWFRERPQSGFEFNLSMSLSEKDILSDVSSRVFKANVTKLWNLGHSNPPIAVLGWRSGVATTFSKSDEGGLSNLPPSLKQYLGGSTTLRGFGFQELPDVGGGQTSFFSSLEIRLPSLLPWGLQPLAFADVGTVSADALSLNAPWYGSPGGGLRLESPIGVFRSSLSRGIVFGNRTGSASALSHWQFHLTFGEEF